MTVVLGPTWTYL